MDAAKTRLAYNNYLINNDAQKESFFEHSYISYKNFARFTKNLEYNSTFDFGNKSNIKLNVEGGYGDLITNLIIKFELPDISTTTTSPGNLNIRYSNAIGISLFESIELYIGGNLIDKHSPELLDIISENLTNQNTRDNYDNLVKKYNNDIFDPNTNTSGTFYLPLQFWFCRNIIDKQMNLPLFLLYNDEIELRINIRKFNQVITNENFDSTPFGLPK